MKKNFKYDTSFISRHVKLSVDNDIKDKGSIQAVINNLEKIKEQNPETWNTTTYSDQLKYALNLQRLKLINKALRQIAHSNLQKETIYQQKEIEKKLEVLDQSFKVKKIDNKDYAEEILKSYLTTALWSSIDYNGEPGDANYTIDDIGKDAIEKSLNDINLFIEQAGTILNNLNPENVGHDFWLTRNGHGAGFWDGDYEKNIGDVLTTIAKSFKEVYLYVGDDNKIYID